MGWDNDSDNAIGSENVILSDMGWEVRILIVKWVGNEDGLRDGDFDSEMG